jgi:hypothetical protein
VNPRTAINRINRLSECVSEIINNYQDGLSVRLLKGIDAADKIKTLPGAHSLGLELIKQLQALDLAYGQLEVLQGDINNYESDEGWKNG